MKNHVVLLPSFDQSLRFYPVAFFPHAATDRAVLPTTLRPIKNAGLVLCNDETGHNNNNKLREQSSIMEILCLAYQQEQQRLFYPYWSVHAEGVAAKRLPAEIKVH